MLQELKALPVQSRINRIRLEFKGCGRRPDSVNFTFVLIESDWNLKEGYTDVPLSSLGINRIRLEFKA